MDLNTKPMHQLGKFEIGECQGNLWCSYDKRTLEITGFYLSRPGRERDLIEIEQQYIIDWLCEEYDNENIENAILEELMDEYAREDFVESHSARRLG